MCNLVHWPNLHLHLCWFVWLSSYSCRGNAEILWLQCFHLIFWVLHLNQWHEESHSHKYLETCLCAIQLSLQKLKSQLKRELLKHAGIKYFEIIGPRNNFTHIQSFLNIYILALSFHKFQCIVPVDQDFATFHFACCNSLYGWILIKCLVGSLFSDLHNPSKPESWIWYYGPRHCGSIK